MGVCKDDASFIQISHMSCIHIVQAPKEYRHEELVTGKTWSDSGCLSITKL